jgi:hypothetical protein
MTVIVQVLKLLAQGECCQYVLKRNVDGTRRTRCGCR